MDEVKSWDEQNPLKNKPVPIPQTDARDSENIDEVKLWDNYVPLKEQPVSIPQSKLAEQESIVIAKRTYADIEIGKTIAEVKQLQIEVKTLRDRVTQTESIIGKLKSFWLPFAGALAVVSFLLSVFWANPEFFRNSAEKVIEFQK